MGADFAYPRSHRPLLVAEAKPIRRIGGEGDCVAIVLHFVPLDPANPGATRMAALAPSPCVAIVLHFVPLDPANPGATHASRVVVLAMII